MVSRRTIRHPAATRDGFFSDPEFIYLKKTNLKPRNSIKNLTNFRFKIRTLQIVKGTKEDKMALFT